jgi:tetratricopeptide (TPR) repeat protein
MIQTTLEQSMQIAMRHHRDGQLAIAEDIYRKVLAQSPNHPDALHLLGLIAADSGKTEAGIELIRRAIVIKPSDAEYHSNLGNALGKLGKFDEAIAAHRIAARLKPDYAEVHYNLANALMESGRTLEAIVEYRQAIQLRPDFASPNNNLGHALYLDGQMDGAIEACHRAIQLDPGYFEAYFNLGLALQAKGRIDESIAATREALRLRLDSAEAHYNLGNALHDIERYEEAIAAYRQALRFKHDYPEAHNNLGIALRDSGRLNDANAAFLDALRIRNENPAVHWNLALNYLLQGNFKDGWAEHEWRWQCESFPSPRRNFRQPIWDGRNLNGQTILLHSEQGFGDTIQFVRYAPMVADRGGRVVLQCQPELVRLLKCNPQLGEVISADDAIPEFEFHGPLLSLPRAFNTDINSIPAATPYLRVDRALAEAWKERLVSAPRGFRVGLVWAGRPTHKRDRHRSFALTQFLPMAAVNGVSFFSLQKGPASKQIDNLPQSMKLIDYSSDLHDFADTAALIANLDLVIGADTAVIHLAAAMGKPVWLLLPAIPDWRWLMNREDSPWYPTMRLYRQTSLGDWAEVLNRVTGSLAKFRLLV